jgi:uncharacterized membrane protein
MSGFQLATFILSIVTLVLIPAVLVLLRGAVRWTKVEDKLDRMVGRMEELVKDKDQTHAEILTQMREDRNATNRRLRWLEENLWGGGRKSA